jgi:putative addiction module killer protein
MASCAGWQPRCSIPSPPTSQDYVICENAPGNFGDCKSVGRGLEELRIDYGPGYRIYYGRPGSSVVVLLCGGDKSTQARDILTAQKYWKEYLDAEAHKAED